jgi:hypothetical protein
VARGEYTYLRELRRTHLLRLSKKSLGGLLSVGFGSATLQEQALCAQFQQFISSSVRDFDSFQTVSLGTRVNSM